MFRRRPQLSPTARDAGVLGVSTRSRATADRSGLFSGDSGGSRTARAARGCVTSDRQTNEPVPPRDVGALERDFAVGGVLKALGLGAPSVTCGRYTLLEKLGEGGMGSVFRGRDPMLRRDIAIKLIHSHDDEAAGAEIRREARALAKLSDPNVVTVLGVGTDQGQTWLAMELVEGETLREWHKRSRDRLGERRPQTLRILQAAGSGLLAAHREGIVHRDFKPANVLLGNDGTIKVADFGLARESTIPSTLSTSASGRTTPTRVVSSIAGTPLYMAPEQHLGLPLDPRADQFSFAATAWELLGGVSPFARNSAYALMEAKLQGDAAGGSTLPRPWRTALGRALEPDPRHRFATLSELLHALEQPLRSSRWMLWSLGGVLATGGAVAGLGLQNSEDGACAALTGPTWTADQRASLHEAFVQHGTDETEAAWDSVATAVDRFVAQWSTARDEVCRPPGDAVASRCLQAVSRRFDEALVATVDDPQLAANPLRWLAELQPSTCTAAAPSVASYDPEIRQAYDQAAQLRLAGDRDGERAALQRGLSRARTEDDTVAMLEGLLALATLRGASGELQAGLDSAEEAYLLAMKTRRDAWVLKAALGVLPLLTGAEKQLDEFRHWLDVGKAALERLEEDDERARVTLDVRESEYAQASTSDLEAALRLAQRAAERASNLGQAFDDDAVRAQAQLRLAEIYLTTRALAPGEEAARQVIEIAARMYGPEHPFTLARHAHLADSLRQQQSYDDALEAAKTAMRGKKAWFGDRTPEVAHQWMELSQLQRERHEFDDALVSATTAVELADALGQRGRLLIDKVVELSIAQLYVDDRKGARASGERVLLLTEEMLGPTHFDVAPVAYNLAETLYMQKDIPAAKRHYQQAYDIASAHLPPDAGLLAYPLIGLADIANIEGEHDLCLQLVERARKSANTIGEKAVLARADWVLARLWAARSEAKGRVYAHKAIEAFRALGAEPQAAQIEGWLELLPQLLVDYKERRARGSKYGL